MIIMAICISGEIIGPAIFIQIHIFENIIKKIELR